MPSRPGCRPGETDGMELRLLTGELCVCRLPRDAPWPMAPAGTGLFSVTRTHAEVSVVCSPHDAPVGARTEPGWRALEVAGPLDFSLVGILSSLMQPLASAGISVFAVSTFDTDYVLLRSGALDAAIGALRQAGHHVHDAAPSA